MKTAVLSGVLLAVLSFSALAQTAAESGGKKWDISNFDTRKFPIASTQSDVTFDKDILPLFKTSCVRCHGEDRPHGGLRLDTREDLLKGGHDGQMIVVGDSSKSPLVGAIARVNARRAMPPPQRRPGPPPGGAPPASTNAASKFPPPAPPLTAAQVGLVRAWIDQGAK